MPVQRPIPVWFGGTAPAALRRIGRLADGWFPLVRRGPDLEKAIEIVTDAAERAGRGPLPFEGRVGVGPDRGDRLEADVSPWRDLGASHISLDTMRQGYGTVDEHIAALTEAAPVVLAP
jgi:alkanesulfonate monooxygenase SsuD/methylene tetrahydromethanopterin reductase-like flavin-dependent oxidoreductase (luciferase family)